MLFPHPTPLLLMHPTHQAEEARAGQPEVTSSMAVDVEVLSGQVTIWIEDLQRALFHVSSIHKQMMTCYGS